MARRGDRMSDVLKGQRYQYMHEGSNWYISIFGDEDGPLEIWLTVPRENASEQQRSRSNSQAVAALAQEHLQDGVDPLRVVEMLQESVTTDRCEAAMISDALTRYVMGELS
jgi:hypothetical protein